MRDKKRYAVLAAFILNVLWWGTLAIFETDLFDDCSAAVGIFLYLAVMAIQLVGYAFFLWRFQGNKLVYNYVFFPAMIVFSILFLLILMETEAYEQIRPRSGLMSGVEYILYFMLLCFCYSKVFLACLVLAIGDIVTRIREKNFGIRNRDKKKYSVASMLVILCSVLFVGELLLILFSNVEWTNDLNTHEMSDNTYDKTLEYAERIQERKGQAEQRTEERKSKKQLQKKEEELQPEYHYNTEECERVLHMVKKNKGEKWSRQDVEDWMALEWKSDGGEDYVAVMDCSGDSTLNGTLDLTGFHHLKRIDFSRTGVKEVILPDCLTKLGESDFHYCDDLKTLTFGKGIMKVDWEAFDDCGKLEKIVFRGDAPKVDYWISAWREAKIYYPQGTKGWDRGVWKDYNMIPYKKSPK